MIMFEKIFNPEDIKLYSDQITNVIKYCNEKKRRVHLIIKPEILHRTDPQRNHLNGHIQQICRESGNDFDDVKRYVKQMAIPMGYPIQKRAGKDVYDFWGNPVGVSETEADTLQCGYLIDCAHRLASELGIMLEESPIVI